MAAIDQAFNPLSPIALTQNMLEAPMAPAPVNFIESTLETYAPKENPKMVTQELKNERPKKQKLEWCSKCKYKEMANNFYFSIPSLKLKEFIKVIGKPTYINYDKNGYAYWSKQSLIKSKKYSFLNKITIIDSQKCYTTPCKHLGFITIEYIIDIPVNKVIKLLDSSISQDIYYDYGNKIISIRGNTLFYCLSILKLIIEYTNNLVTYRKIIKEKMFEKCTSYNYLQDYSNRSDILDFFV